jgi:hypothetical protein
MVAGGGSKQMRIDEINRAMFPMAGSFDAQVDREMTAFTGVIHRDNLDRFADIALKQLTEPGLRDDDFARIKQRQRNALVLDLRTNNEELGGAPADQHLRRRTATPPLGTVAGIDAITLDDVPTASAARAQANLRSTSPATCRGLRRTAARRDRGAAHGGGCPRRPSPPPSLAASRSRSSRGRVVRDRSVIRSR